MRNSFFCLVGVAYPRSCLGQTDNLLPGYIDSVCQPGIYGNTRNGIMETMHRPLCLNNKNIPKD